MTSLKVKSLLRKQLIKPDNDIKEQLQLAMERKVKEEITDEKLITWGMYKGLKYKIFKEAELENYVNVLLKKGRDDFFNADVYDYLQACV